MNTDFFVGVFGFLQLSMRDVGLLDEQGTPIKKKKMLLSEQDAIGIYNWVADKIRYLPSELLRERASVTDKMVKNLFNDHKVVNNFLLAILLLREYIDNASKSEQILMSGKINRLVDVVDGAVSDEEFDVDIKRTTFRTANNLYRQFTGKAQLTDEVRDANVKRFIR